MVRLALGAGMHFTFVGIYERTLERISNTEAGGLNMAGAALTGKIPCIGIEKMCLSFTQGKSVFL